MRLSSLVIAVATVLFLSVALWAQHSSGGGGGGGGASSSGGHSGGGSSGGGFHGSSAGGSAGSHFSGGRSSSSASGRSNSAGSGRTSPEGSLSERVSFGRTFSQQSFKGRVGTELNVRPNLLRPPINEKVEEKPEKRGFFSFLHHQKPAPALARAAWINPRFPCKKGQNCVLPPVCQTGFGWNSYSCGAFYDQYWWFNSCQALAYQLAAEQQLMAMAIDPGESVRYQMLMDQYQQCMSLYGADAFSSYLFMSALDGLWW